MPLDWFIEAHGPEWKQLHHSAVFRRGAQRPGSSCSQNLSPDFTRTMYRHWLQGDSELEGSFRPQPLPVSIHSRMLRDNLRKSLDIFVLSGTSRCQSRKDSFFLTFWLHLHNFLLSRPGIEPSPPPPQWKHEVLTTGLPGKSPERIIGAAANRKKDYWGCCK